MRKIIVLVILAITILLGSCSNQQQAKDELYLAKETAIAEIYVKRSENASATVDILSEQFANHYDRLTEMFDYTPPHKTIIHVYTDLDEFQQIIGRQTEGTYDAEDRVIKVYTPSDLSNDHIRNEYKTQLIHEFIHAIIQSINPIVGHVKWLDEGTAYYASHQLQEAITSGQYSNSKAPTLEQFESSPTYFDEYGGTAYYYSGLIVQFFIEQYGMDKFNEILRDPLNLENILGKSIEQLYQEWIVHLDG